jgi:hypothetical protein
LSLLSQLDCRRSPPKGPAIAFGEAVAQFSHPKRIPRRTTAAQHVAVLNCVASVPSRKPKTQTGALAASANTYPQLPVICAMTREVSETRTCSAGGFWRIAAPYSWHPPALC